MAKVYEIIFRKIQNEIESGELKIGDKLPSERELAAQYGVSRTSIREALRLLELGDVVDIRQGDGTFVKNITLNSVQQQLSNVLQKSNKVVLYEMLELRQLLESQCAALAALRATGQDIENMARALEQMKQADEQPHVGLQADLAFHLAIAEATHNSVLSELIAALAPHMSTTIEITREHRLSSPGSYERTYNEHKAIYIAISRGESDKARVLMEEHIRTVRQEISELTI